MHRHIRLRQVLGEGAISPHHPARGPSCPPPRLAGPQPLPLPEHPLPGTRCCSQCGWSGLAGSWPRCARRGNRTRGRSRRRRWPPARQDTHSRAHTWGCTVAGDRARLAGDPGLQRGPRGCGGAYTVHVQGLAALLTAGPAGPRRGVATVKVDHGRDADWGGRGRSGEPNATAKLAALRAEHVIPQVLTKLGAEITEGPPPAPAHLDLGCGLRCR